MQFERDEIGRRLASRVSSRNTTIADTSAEHSVSRNMRSVGSRSLSCSMACPSREEGDGPRHAFSAGTSQRSQGRQLHKKCDLGCDHRPPQWVAHLSAVGGFELSTEDRRQLYIPEGFAHGFQTLSEDAEVAYLISEFYEPLAARGVRYNDPAFRIVWPLPTAAISERDASWPELSLAAA